MKSIQSRKMALWLLLALGACGVAEGPVDFTGSTGTSPELRSLTETGAAGAAGAAGAESD